MSLRLTIENVPSLTSGDPIEMVLEQHGLVIGRAAHADWTLPDPRSHISSIHCEIDYRDGRYYLTDRSTNGTFVNGSGDRLAKPWQLRDGDLIQIGAYEVRVEEIPEDGAGASAGGDERLEATFAPGLDWSQGAGGAAKASDPGRFGREPPKPLFQSGGDPMMRAFAAPSAAPAVPAGGGNPFGLGGDPAPAPGYAPVHPATSAYAAPAGGDPFGIGGSAPAAPAPPPVAAPAPAGDDIWAKLQGFGTVDFGASPPPPPPPAAVAPTPAASSARAAAPAVATGSDGGALFDRFLAACGLKRSDIGANAPETVLDAAGQLLTQATDGLIRLLDARTRVRHQFGVGANVTTFQRAGNNPLKWTRSPAQALKQMIGEPEAGFLSGPQAVRGAFEDMQAHEVALIAAMQEAMQATIARFSPDAIKQRISARGWLKSVLPGAREATLWRAYETEFKAFADETEAAYLDLFAKHFKKAYERNIQKVGS